MKLSLDKISFGKKLVAKADIIKNEKPHPCTIYLLERGIDFDYFEKQRSAWKKAEYLEPVEAELESKHSPNFYFDSDIYALEDSKGKCLGYCEQDEYKDRNILITLETCPKYCADNEKRKVKYVGETLLTFLAALAKKEDKNAFTVHTVVSGAQDFYTKCGFDDGSEGMGRKLDKNKFSALIQQNQNHTGGGIEFLL